MHIVMIAFGSRGDVQPYVALGLGLQRAGFAVTLVSSDDFEPFITERGLRFRSLGFDARQIMETPSFRQSLETGRNTAKAVSGLVRLAFPAAEAMLSAAWDACQDADAIIGSTVGALLGYQIAEKLGLPFFLANPFLAPTRALPNPLFPLRASLGSAFNLLTHAAVEQTLWLAFGFVVRDWRRALDLPPLPLLGYPFHRLHGRPVPHLYGHSPHVLPRPADWPAAYHVTGYWFLDHDPAWQPPPDLSAFLAAGAPPVYVGFGSMSNRDPAATAQLVIDAVQQSGQRGILAAGWDGLNAQDVPDSVFLLEACPHDWLFPRMAAVVHHGGAGTTAAGLRAGVPSIIVPFFGDQPFWGDCVAGLGVGPLPLPRQTLTAARLAYAIRVAAAHSPLRARAAALGQQIQQEAGVENAVAVIRQALA